jgi:hypothetical protein
MFLSLMEKEATPLSQACIQSEGILEISLDKK